MGILLYKDIFYLLQGDYRLLVRYMRNSFGCPGSWMKLEISRLLEEAPGFCLC